MRPCKRDRHAHYSQSYKTTSNQDFKMKNIVALPDQSERKLVASFHTQDADRLSVSFNRPLTDQERQNLSHVIRLATRVNVKQS